MEEVKIFETHAHYDDEAFDTDRRALLEQMHGDNVETIINVCASVKSLMAIPELIDEYRFVYGAIGIHPDEVGDITPEVWGRMQELCDLEKVVAVGEIGLDYYWDKENHKKQIDWFEKQMDLAGNKKLPILVHSRDAAADTLEVMKHNHAGDIGGIVHCFSYGVELAREYLNMGLSLGIGGVVTFKNAKKVKEVVAYMPMDQLVLETDSPYLAPVPHRGERNCSAYISLVAEEIARIKGITPEEVIAVTNQNAKKIFHL